MTNRDNYLIYIDKENIYAKNGKTGNIDFKSTDPTKVINNASDALSNKGSYIYICDGTYLLSGPIVIRHPHTIRGAGKGATILKTNSAFNAIQINPTYAWNYDSASIKDITLDGNNVGKYGIIFDGGIDTFVAGKTVGCYFENMTVKNFTEFGVYENSNWGNTYVNCKIMSNGTSAVSKGGICLFSNATTFIGCRIDWNGTGVVARNGRNNAFYNCVIEGNGYHGVHGYSTIGSGLFAFNYVLDGCYFEANNVSMSANIRDIYLADINVKNWTISNTYTLGNNVDYSMYIVGKSTLLSHPMQMSPKKIYISGNDSTIINAKYHYADESAIHPDSFPLSRSIMKLDKYLKNSGVANSIIDGGKIVHRLATIPTVINITGTVSGEIVTIAGLDYTYITVDIKKTDKSSGTAQTIYWEAEV